MPTQDGRVELSEITDFNLLKSELNRLPAVDVRDYIAELPPERWAIDDELWEWLVLCRG
jgi:magnesium transporter